MNRPAAESTSRLSVASPVGDVLRRLIEMELDFAQHQLSATTSEHEVAVHQCRKAIKRMRAIVSLSAGIPGADPRTIDRRLRAAGRRLSPTRDAAAIANALAKLIDAEPNIASLEQLDAIAGSVEAVDVPIDRARAALEAVRSRLTVFFDEPTDWTFARIADGIEVTYSAAVTREKRFVRKASDSRAHALRKTAQRLLHQLGAIEALCPDYLTAPLAQLEQLADVLGDHHDLAVLRARLKARKKMLPGRTHWRLKTSAKLRQLQLVQRALDISAGLLEHEGRAFRDALLAACADPEQCP